MRAAGTRAAPVGVLDRIVEGGPARLAVPLAGAAVGVEAGWLILGLPDAALVSDLGAIVVASLAAVACASTVHRHPAGLRRFWTLLAVTMALAAIGRIVWTASRLITGGLPNNPLVGTLFFAGIVTGTAALLSFLTAPRSAVARARTVLDGVIVGLSLVPVGWIVVFRDVTAAELNDPLRALGLLYPMFDLIQLTILVAVAGPARPRWRPLAIIGVSLAIRAAADTVYVSLIVQEMYFPGHPIDVCWPLTYLLVAVASRHRPPPDHGTVDGAEAQPVPWWRIGLPYLPIAAAIAAIVLARDAAGYTPPLIFTTGMCLLAALGVRQTLAATENSRLADGLSRLAYSDQLTGLPNRLLFSRRLRQAIRADQPVAVLLLDLDGFKQVNDRFGHATGDALLGRIASHMRTVVGADGTIARLGGDEFAVLVDGDRQVRPEDLADRLLTALRSTTLGEDLGVRSSASIGIAEYGPQHAGDADLLRDADIAMYAAKAAGKSAYRICTPGLREAAVTRAELIGDLRRAVDEGDQLELRFQPIVDVVTGSVHSAEALVRWRHPSRGLLPPARFLPLAEETGLILPIDRWVLAEACRAAATWRELSPATTVAVNIASMHLRRPEITATVEAAARAAGLPPQALTLELTETALIDGTDAVLTRLCQLRELGVRIAIDDFGTGYSSLSYLHRIPASELKIDRTFVARLGDNSQAYATVDMVTKLASAYGMLVVAEGVETDAQHAVVRAIGCPRGQGYRYGRPGSLAELRESILAR
ncbi:EAL domain-containing protein [Solwaraspora sp. WMMD1047]|uniref:putative bifunctional diguanylate cyclase/phosphodiesterase n=1 Tax=Solwaraspora sp. WMMD1047 TaxID=3016102 RepID=UPI002416E328|nr:EAL domain-containing protein [Solwaraspora sp. WMMD1047]MDG4832874.1 EAL domain-containing protein [Solwaraspora sp. WMMD1047]